MLGINWCSHYHCLPHLKGCDTPLSWNNRRLNRNGIEDWIEMDGFKTAPADRV